MSNKITFNDANNFFNTKDALSLVLLQYLLLGTSHFYTPTYNNVMTAVGNTPKCFRLHSTVS